MNAEKTGIIEVKLKIAFAIFLTLCYRTPAASGLTHVHLFYIYSFYSPNTDYRKSPYKARRVPEALREFPVLQLVPYPAQ